MPSQHAITVRERERLIERIKTDPAFREKLKDNWVDAFRDVGINPSVVKGRVLQHDESTPFAGGPALSGITITITIFAEAGRERIDLGDAVIFDEKLT
jgi:hypothetical protein